jgi:hypothetical protein
MPAGLKQFIKSRCYDFGTLYSLNDEFNKIGLTILPTNGGDMVLCRLVEGRPVAESLGIDHIYVGVQSRPRDELPHKLAKCVLEFIDSAGGDPSRPSVADQPHRTGHTGFYGLVGPVVQDMALGEADIGSDLLGAIREWCDAQV